MAHIAPPPAEYSRSGRTWTFVRREPHLRMDGSETELLVWQSLCRACSAPFEIKTTANFQASKAFGTVHCPVHRRR